MTFERNKTGGGPPPKKLSLAIERTIDLCKDSSSFKGISGFESGIPGLSTCAETRTTTAELPEEGAGSQDLFESAQSQPPSPSILVEQPNPVIVREAPPVIAQPPAETRKKETAKKRKATVEDVYEKQVKYFDIAIEKEKKTMKKLDLQIQLLERLTSPTTDFSQITAQQVFASFY